MSKTAQQTITLFLFLTGLGLFIGCGDGQRQHRQTIRRANAKPIIPFDNRKGQPGSNGPTGPLGQGQTPIVDSKANRAPTLPDDKAIEHNNAFTSALAFEGGGPDTNNQDSPLPDGIYKLQRVATVYKFNKPVSVQGRKKQVLVQSLVANEVQWSSPAAPQASPSSSSVQPFGNIEDYLQGGIPASERISNVPGSFSVNQGRVADRVEYKHLELTTGIRNSSNKTGLEHIDVLQPVGAGPSRGLDLINLLQTKTPGEVGVQPPKIRAFKDPSGQDLFRVIINIDEGGKPEVSRQLILTYTLDKSTPSATTAPIDGAQN